MQQSAQQPITHTKRESNARGDGDQLRSQLVAAASDLLLAPQSIALPSLRAVARACNVSPAAVYLHFESQRALILAVVDEQLAQLARFIEARVAESHIAKAPVDRLAALAIAYADWGLAHPGAYQLLFESADQLGIETHENDSNWDLIRLLASQIEQATDALADAARLAAFRLWASVHGAVSLRLHKPAMDWPTKLHDDVLELVASATRALPTANTPAQPRSLR